MDGSKVTLWLNPNEKCYAERDVITKKDDSHSVVLFSGSKTAHLNQLVSKGNKVHVKEDKRWVVVGEVQEVKRVDKSGLQMFELLVENRPAEKFRTKAEAVARFGWTLEYPACLPGIIHHTRA